MKSVLRAIGLIGAMLFGLGLALTFVSPLHYEKAARTFLEQEIEQRVKERVNFGEDSRLGNLAKALMEKHRQEITNLKERFWPALRTRIAALVGEMQNTDCECRKRALQGLALAETIAGKLQISAFEKAEPQLRRLVEGNYGELVSSLLRDLRIFTGTNLAAFTLLLLLSFLKPTFLRQLFIPGLLLAAASLTSSAMYIFGQNWFFTLLHNDYVGPAYIVWIALIYGFLCDIALFKARVTTAILNNIASSVDVVSPC